MAHAATQRHRVKASRDAERWAAVATRSGAHDGAFVYAVTTTGIYCRPSCPSRRALRCNVTFFASPIAAEAAGYRACLRCRPRDGGTRARDAERVTLACRMLERAERAPTLTVLAKAAGLSPFHFHRMFKAELGMTPKAYADSLRAARLRDGLASSTTVTDAVYAAGFGSIARFYAHSAKMLGMPPSVFKAGGCNVTLKVAMRASAIGRVLVAATENGVAAVLIGESDAALKADLRVRFPNADIAAGDKAFDDLVGRVVSAINGPGIDTSGKRKSGKVGSGKASALPLDVQGTAFQHKVWAALQAVPAGTTATYSEIADAIGQPTAMRAVAQACGANPVAVLIPCHRIVRSDGALSGYRWGVARKQALLSREGAQHQPPSKTRKRGKAINAQKRGA